MMRGDDDGPAPRRRFPGRFFARWEPDAARATCSPAPASPSSCSSPTGRAEWLHALARRARTLPDSVGPGMRLLMCGLNPSLYSADAGVGFARPGQPVLARRARRRPRDPSTATRGTRSRTTASA